MGLHQEIVTHWIDLTGEAETVSDAPTSSQPFVNVSTRDWHLGEILLDRYEVMAVLGTGGNGRVYKVYHREWGLELAVKTPLREKVAQESLRAAFLQEAETWANLKFHPNVVRCVYVRTIGDLPRIFMDYVAGGSLSEWITTRRLYSGGTDEALARILDIAIQCAWGLHHAHENGLVHQDLKPANVLIDTNDTARVTDFGLAGIMTHTSLRENGEIPSATYTGRTPAYCSPEQALAAVVRDGDGSISRPRVSRGTDVWSWGLTVLEMFYGEPPSPMGGQVAPEVLRQFLLDGQPDTAIPAMPAEAADLLTRCFQIRVEDRPGTLLEVADALQHIYQQKLARPYPKRAPLTTRQIADALNNRGVSLRELGRLDEAEAMWKEALAADPLHLHAGFNFHFMQYRLGVLDDDAVGRSFGSLLDAHTGDALADMLHARFYLFQGYMALALEVLQNTTGANGLLSPDMAADLSIARWCLGQDELAFGGLSQVDHYRARVLHLEMQAYQHGPERLGLKIRRLAGLVDAAYAREWAVHRSPVVGLAVSGDKTTLFALGSDGEAAAIDMNSGALSWRKRTLNGPRIRLVQLSEGVGIDSGDGRIVVLDDSGKMQRDLGVPCSPQGEPAFCYLMAEVEGRIRVATLYPRGAPTVATVAAWHEGMTSARNQVTSCQFAWDIESGLFAIADQLNRISIWDAQTAKETDYIFLATEVSCLLLAQSGQLVIAGGVTGEIFVFWRKDGKIAELALSGHQRHVRCLTLRDQHLLSGSMDGTIRLWDLRTRECIYCYRGHEGTVHSVMFVGDDLICSGGSDGRVLCWRMPSMSSHAPFVPVRPRASEAVAHSAERFTSLLEQAKRLEKQERFFQAHAVLRQAQSVSGYEYAEDVLALLHSIGRRSGRFGGLHTVWRARLIVGVAGRICSLAISGDDRLVCTTDLDGNLRVWEIASGDCLPRFRTSRKLLPFATVRATFGVESDSVLVGCNDNHIRRLDLSKNDFGHNIYKLHSSIELISVGTGFERVALSADKGRDVAASERADVKEWIAWGAFEWSRSTGSNPGSAGLHVAIPAGDHTLVGSAEMLTVVVDGLFALRHVVGPHISLGIVDTATGNTIADLDLGRGVKAVWVEVCHGLAVVARRHKIEFLSVRTFQQVRPPIQFKARGLPTALACSPDGRILAAGTLCGELVWIDIYRGTVLSRIDTGQREITTLSFSRSGRRLGVGYDDGGIDILEIDRELELLPDA